MPAASFMKTTSGCMSRIATTRRCTCGAARSISITRWCCARLAPPAATAWASRSQTSRTSTRPRRSFRKTVSLTRLRSSRSRAAACSLPIPSAFRSRFTHRWGSVRICCAATISIGAVIPNGKGPRLHHFAYWVPTAMNILHLCDVMASAGYLKNIERGPGRHGISNAFFLYIRDPDGHRLELYTSDYFTMDHDHEPMRWSLKDPRRQTLWGAPAPRSWFEQGSPFPGQPIREPLFTADVTIAD